MGDLGLDPETALKLVRILLRWAAYFFAGFALLGFSTYVVFLCLEMFAEQPRTKAKIAQVPQLVGRTPVLEQAEDLIPVEIPTLAEDATVTVGEVLCHGQIPVDFPGISAHHRPLSIDTNKV